MDRSGSQCSRDTSGVSSPPHEIGLVHQNVDGAVSFSSLGLHLPCYPLQLEELLCKCF